MSAEVKWQNLCGLLCDDFDHLVQTKSRYALHDVFVYDVIITENRVSDEDDKN